jgi:hypothetical protein
MRVYLNGRQDGVRTSNLSIGDTNQNLVFGRLSDSDSQLLDGIAAHIAIWQAALTPHEVWRLSNGGVSPLKVRPDALRGYWPLDDYPDSDDLSRYRNTATQIGTVALRPPSIPSSQTLLAGGAEVLVDESEEIDVPFIAATTTLHTPTLEGVYDALPPFLAPQTVLAAPALKAAIANVSLPTISGTPTEGLVLTASPGVWSGTPPLTFAYQWELCNAGGGSCAAITGATNPQHIVRAADVGGTLRVVVTATDQ